VQATRSLSRPTNALQNFALGDLFQKSSDHPLIMLREGAVGLEAIDNSRSLTPQDLYIEIFRESFEIAEDDDTGIFIEINSDFLLGGAHLVLQNTMTGTILEDERHQGTGTLTVGLLAPGRYVVLVYTHKCITNMQLGDSRVLKSFDMLLDMRVRPLRKLSGHGRDMSKATMPVKLTDNTGS